MTTHKEVALAARLQAEGVVEEVDGFDGDLGVDGGAVDEGVVGAFGGELGFACRGAGVEEGVMDGVGDDELAGAAQEGVDVVGVVAGFGDAVG